MIEAFVLKALYSFIQGKSKKKVMNHTNQLTLFNKSSRFEVRYRKLYWTFAMYLNISSWPGFVGCSSLECKFSFQMKMSIPTLYNQFALNGVLPNSAAKFLKQKAVWRRGGGECRFMNTHGLTGSYVKTGFIIITCKHF